MFKFYNFKIRVNCQTQLNVVELREEDFVGIYFEPIQGDRLRLKKTKVKETIDFRCVFGPDVVVGQKAKGKANEYTISAQMDMELCHFSG